MSGDNRKPKMSCRERDAAARICTSNVCDGIGAEMQSGGLTPIPAVAGEMEASLRVVSETFPRPGFI